MLVSFFFLSCLIVSNLALILILLVVVSIGSIPAGCTWKVGEAQLTEFLHLAFFLFLSGFTRSTLVLHSLGGIDDWKSRWEIATKDEITIGFDVPKVTGLFTVEPLPVQLEHS